MKDSTRIEWVSRAKDAMAIVSMSAAVTALLASGVWWLIGPRVQPFIDLVPQVASLSHEVSALRKEMAESRRGSSEPVLRFAERGHEISDGAPGNFVRFRWLFTKLRGGCGAPVVSLYLVNGDGLIHRFTAVSITDMSGRGIDLGPGQNEITYTAQIPVAAQPGPARGWVTLDYPECHAAPAAVSPEVPFTILDAG